MPTMSTLRIDDGELACIGLGANLGEARATLQAAIDALAALPSTRLVAVSPFYRTAPIDSSGPDYINAVALLRTGLAPHELLHRLQDVERVHGRERSIRNAPRTLDLDVLIFGDRTVASPELTLPHPRIQERAFVLRPLLDVLPSAIIPGLGPAIDWLPHVADQRIERLSP